MSLTERQEGQSEEKHGPSFSLIEPGGLDAPKAKRASSVDFQKVANTMVAPYDLILMNREQRVREFNNDIMVSTVRNVGAKTIALIHSIPTK